NAIRSCRSLYVAGTSIERHVTERSYWFVSTSNCLTGQRRIKYLYNIEYTTSTTTVVTNTEHEPRVATDMSAIVFVVAIVLLEVLEGAIVVLKVLELIDVVIVVPEVLGVLEVAVVIVLLEVPEVLWVPEVVGVFEVANVVPEVVSVVLRVLIVLE